MSDASRPARSLMTDPSAVEQILFNLVDNACKYAAGATHAHDSRAGHGRRAARGEFACAITAPASGSRMSGDCFGRFPRRPTRPPLGPRRGPGTGAVPAAGAADGRRSALRSRPTAQGATFLLSLPARVIEARSTGSTSEKAATAAVGVERARCR